MRPVFILRPRAATEFFSRVDRCVDGFSGDLTMAACQKNPENASPGCARRLPGGPSRRSSRAQALDLLGRQADRFRRSHPANGDQGLPRQLPRRRRWAEAPNKRVAIGYYGKVTVEQARKLAQNLLGQVAGGAGPAYERAKARAMPTLGEAFEEYMAVNPNRSKRTGELYRYEANRYLGDWLTRTLDSIARRDVEMRFNSITADHGWSPANRAISLLRSVYRRPCVDYEGLRPPGASDHPATRGHSRAPAGRGRRLPGRGPRLGVPLAHRRHRPCSGPGSPLIPTVVDWNL